MKRFLWHVLFLMVLAGAALTVQPPNSPVVAESPSLSQGFPAEPIRYVLMVTVDGLKPETYTEPDEHGLKVPTLRLLVRNGAWSSGAQPVMPTVTYPSHTTMATGVNPGTHGIVTNPAWDPLDQNLDGYRFYAEDIRVPTLWQLARQRGLRTALVRWPVSVGAQADLNVPEIWRANTPDDLKLIRALSTPRGIFASVEKAFPGFDKELDPAVPNDVIFTDIACYAIKHLKPNLLMLHLPTVDYWEHQTGPFSKEADDATEIADAQIARLIATAKQAGTWQQTALILLSDHGFAPISQQMKLGILLAQHRLLSLDPHGRPISWKATAIINGGSAYIYVKDAHDDPTKRAVLDIFKPLVGKPGSGIRRLASHEEIVDMGGDTKAFLAMEAADGTSFVNGYSGDLISKLTETRGTHGYFPDRAEMRTSLVVYGPAIQHAKIQGARLIDVAPTVAYWLGLPLTTAQGKPLAVAVKMPAASH